MLQFKRLSWQLIKLLIRLQFPEIQQLSPKDLAVWLQKDGVSKPLLLDVRTREEYEVSHLKNARLAPSNLEDLIEGGKNDFSTPIVVYCSIGYRSCQIARRLQSMGYQTVFNLSGSIFQWVNENRLVYRDSKPVSVVHPYQKFWQYLLLNKNIQVNL
ncbi:rhodanese-like domain-containing protein [Pleurocapsa sp. FMAR1]|uniref:rhodanese-like domain-containing protein n=1 Tax=Pleurocapsa sp. FMAR1 TaxID=3040204 RepID=UPI0029C79E2E|nr:rhodanese-like domain-containing protein [Pleurocapsa sp. FMAR1]